MSSRPTANRWHRYDVWDERPLNLDGFAPDSPDDGFRATNSTSDLILLCHKICLSSGLLRPLPQHGHLGRVCASRKARCRLTVGIEFAT